MVQFSRLRLQGFKSFVDKVELEIAPGLNGVVGPNGCGKSNLVEALRWVMGENSAKRMRGGGMEDVIFNGTEIRASRNIAEVSLMLDNTERTAPAQYNNQDEIEISRKIERDKGSQYRINGKVVRARDVQMFFADSVSGAQSPALVSQGRVTEIIKAKPMERRLILEDSAGISGLFVRRHEAELKLKAADNNLLRMEDLLAGMETRLNSLRRQAKQASRYRNLNAQVRQFELTIGHVEYESLLAKIKATKAEFENAESQVVEKLGVVTQLTKTQTTQAEDLPELRKVEASEAAALQNKKITLQRLEDAAARQAEMLREAKEQLERLSTDRLHESNNERESEELLTKLKEEHEQITSQQDGSDVALKEKEDAYNAREGEVSQLEEKYNILMQGVAENKARRDSLEQQMTQNETRVDTLRSRKKQLEDELATLEATDEHKGDVGAIEAEIALIVANVAELKAGFEAIEIEIAAHKDVVEATDSKMRAARDAASAQRVEIEMLETFFETQDDLDYEAVLDQMKPKAGFEKALSRALGDTLMASLEEDAPVHWFTRKSAGDMPDLPDGVEALLPYVKAPQALHLALSQIGFIEDEATGADLIEALKPGQSLVSKDGTYWRWDGLCVRADAADRHAAHMEQQNKLQDLKAGMAALDSAFEIAEASAAAAVQAAEDFSLKRSSLSNDLRVAENLLHSKQVEAVQLKEKQARFEGQKAHVSDNVKTVDEDLATLEEVLQWDRDRLAALETDDADEQEKSLEALRQNLAEGREAYNDAMRSYERFVQEMNSLKAREHAIADERVNINNRHIRSRERLKELTERQGVLETRLEELEAQPQDNEADQEALLLEISDLEARRTKAAEELAVCERGVYETGRAMKEAETLLGDMREKRAHAQATLGGMQEQLGILTASIDEKFSMPPQELEQHVSLDLAQMASGAEALPELRAQKDRLVHDRERMGAVNLRAEEELEELDAEVSGLFGDRDELMQAIEELRGGIEKINVEARERLLNAFDTVNGHFQRLFEQLFVGGKAHLALVDSDDPLEAGLEIFAQPPGKALQALSLLSGGEQTMASIALIFGMFLTNPSPICVLDEIDAPLDDSNVDRVCDLLETIAARGDTRFVVVTHHRMTMARMDRLYGVTMVERGISQLLSVDLQQSFDFVEAA